MTFEWKWGNGSVKCWNLFTFHLRFHLQRSFWICHIITACLSLTTSPHTNHLWYNSFLRSIRENIFNCVESELSEDMIYWNYFEKFNARSETLYAFEMSFASLFHLTVAWFSSKYWSMHNHNEREKYSLNFSLTQNIKVMPSKCDENVFPFLRVCHIQPPAWCTNVHILMYWHRMIFG